jgi:S-adenosylmethionine:tRNA ribosyltransferase-isomerase
VKLSEFYYDLPPELIAQEPVTPRDQSKLLIVSAKKDSLEHKRFSDLSDYLNPGDALVLNSTKVFPARLRGKKKSGGKVELLLVRPMAEKDQWTTLVRGISRAATMEFPGDLRADCVERTGEGEWIVQFSGPPVRDVLERFGDMPLPPYIKRPKSQTSDRDRYQTVFAKEEGAIAAPTAGFHFTPELLERLRKKGIQMVEIVLHVGWGTFRPVRSENVEDHAMLPERCRLSAEAAERLNGARKSGHRIVAVGTTAVRTLESAANAEGKLTAFDGETNLFIYPGYRFKSVDALITNFHLPDSTPLLLANAFFCHLSGRVGARESGSKDFAPPHPIPSSPPPFSLRAAYAAAIQHRYRFYSYGDAMLIL